MRPAILPPSQLRNDRGRAFLDTLPDGGTFNNMNRTSAKATLRRKPAQRTSGRSLGGRGRNTKATLADRSLIDPALAQPVVLSLNAGQNAAPSLIIREREPENLEFPFSSLSSTLTPNEQFFVRSHFPVPELDPRNWKLLVEGQVERCLQLKLVASTAAGRNHPLWVAVVGALLAHAGAAGQIHAHGPGDGCPRSNPAD